MPSFRWSAINGGGEVVHGVMDAPDRAWVVDRLQRQGQTVLRADPADRRRGLGDLLQLEIGGGRGLDKNALNEVTRELAIMLAAGQDLDRALRFVVNNTRSARARAILSRVRDKVRSGSSLAAALASEPRSFSKLYIGMVRAGEAGGTLPATLDRLSALLERERSLTASLRSSMIYPALLVVAAIGSIFLLLDYVLPQFTPIFEQSGAQLPTATRVLMTLGAVAGAATPWLLAATVVAAGVGRRLLTLPAYRIRFDRLLLRLPVAGSLMRETLAARLTRTLGNLLENGVALIPALGIAKEALGNLAAAEAVERRGGEGQRRRRLVAAARRRRDFPGPHHPPLAAWRGGSAARGDVAEGGRHPRRAGSADDAAARGAGGAADHDRDGTDRRRHHQRVVDGDAEPQ